MLNKIVVLLFQLRNIDNIIDLIRAIGNRIYGFVFLDLGRTLPQGKTNRRAHMDRCSRQQILAQGNGSRVDRHHGKAVLASLCTELFKIPALRIGAQLGVVKISCQFGRCNRIHNKSFLSFRVRQQPLQKRCCFTGVNEALAVNLAGFRHHDHTAGVYAVGGHPDAVHLRSGTDAEQHLPFRTGVCAHRFDHR